MENKELITERGYIKLFRKLDAWEWYDDANTMRLFIHCLIKANYMTKKWQGQTIHAGSFVTSYPKLAQDLKLSVQSVRTSIKKLKSTGEITYSGTSRNSIIIVNNWDKFQTDNTQPNTQVTDEQQTTNRQLTPTNNDKKEKNIYRPQNKKFQKPTLEEVQAYCLERGNNVDASKFIDYYESKGWIVGKSPMKDWQASVRNWVRYQEKYDSSFNNSNQATSLNDDDILERIRAEKEE